MRYITGLVGNLIVTKTPPRVAPGVDGADRVFFASGSTIFQLVRGLPQEWSRNGQRAVARETYPELDEEIDRLDAEILKADQAAQVARIRKQEALEAALPQLRRVHL